MPVQAGQPRYAGGVDGGDHVRVEHYVRGGLQREILDPHVVYSETGIVAS
jgi:hypothetical protein